MNDSKKVCLITGVGPGTGSALVRRFAAGGYTIAMLARSEDRLAELTEAVPDAHAFACDVSDLEALRQTVTRVEKDLGPIHTVIHNAVSATLSNYLELDPADLRKNFEINTVALLRLAQLTTPAMMERGEGVFMATGNTSAYRGKANFAGFAPTKAAQRIMLESIARHSGPMGVHAVYVAIDAVINVPWTREVFADKPEEFFCQPDDIAQACYDIAHQPKTTWSSDVVIRPYGEEW